MSKVQLDIMVMKREALKKDAEVAKNMLFVMSSLKLIHPPEAEQIRACQGHDSAMRAMLDGKVPIKIMRRGLQLYKSRTPSTISKDLSSRSPARAKAIEEYSMYKDKVVTKRVLRGKDPIVFGVKMRIHERFDDDSHEKCVVYTEWIDEMIDEYAEETDWEALEAEKTRCMQRKRGVRPKRAGNGTRV